MVNRALLAGVIGFASGIVCRSFFIWSWPIILTPVVVGVALLLMWRLRRAGVFLLSAILLLAFALGAGRAAFAPQHPPTFIEELTGTTVELEGHIATDPDIRETTQRVTVEVKDGGERSRVLAVVPLYPELLYGQQVRVAGKLEAPEPFDTDGGRVFRYDRFLAKDGVFGIVNYGRIDVLSEPSGIRAFAGALFAIKHAFVHGLEASLPEPHASLASGLITGGKQGLGSDLLDAFIIAGLVHIVVLSGYNVMIVAEAVLRMLSFLPKRAAAGAAAFTIALFVLTAGAGAASLRAGLMAGIALFGRASGRTYDALRALVFAGLCMLLLNPLLLAFDPGFQLSFVATAGLILGSPVVERWLAFIKSRMLRELLSATVAAQISVLPLLLYQTGNLSLVALPANVLVLPVVPFAMLLSFIAGTVSLVLPIIGPLIGAPAFVLLAYIVGIAEGAAALPFAHLIIPQFPFVITVFAYVLLVYAVTRLRKKRRP